MAAPASPLLLLLLLGAGRAEPTAAPRPAGDCCPERCECGPRASAVLGRAAKTVLCTGARVPPACVAASAEVLAVRNATARRLDFFALHRTPGLVVLDAAANGLNELAGSGKRAPRLAALDLSRNSLHMLPPFAFRDFAALASLNLSWNGLHTISPSAFLLPRLTVLDLSHNRLSILKEHYFADTPMLQTIDLSSNILSRVPGFVFGRSLHTLALAGNHIIRMEETALEGINITGALDLSSNALRRVPNAALKRAGRIDTLLLDDNLFGWALGAGAVAGLAGVRRVSISRQRALRLVHRGAVTGLDAAEEIWVRDNPQLAYVAPGAVVRAPRLLVLDLSNNALLALEEGVAPKGLRELRVDNNSFPCHCSLRWVQERLVVPEPAPPLISPPCAHGECVVCAAANGSRVPLGSLPPFPPDCAPRILPLFPSAAREPLGGNASFHCRALGSPDTKVHWLSRRGARLFEGDCAAGGRVCVHDHTLTIRYLHREDGGAYTCVARNAAGSDARPVRLAVRDVHVRLLPLAVASTFVTLAWNHSGAALAYALRYTEVGAAPPPDDAPSVTFSAGLKLHSYTVHGLRPRATYEFSLSMVREHYAIPLSSVRVTTKGEAFLSTLGIRRSYLGVVVLGVALGAAVAACAAGCGLRCWRVRRSAAAAAGAAASKPACGDAPAGRCMLPSSSTQSDMAFITYIDLAEEAARHSSESQLGYA